MSAADVPRHGELRCRITPRQRLQLAAFPVGMRLRSRLPRYTPHDYRVPESIAKLSAHFTELAESTR